MDKLIVGFCYGLIVGCFIAHICTSLISWQYEKIVWYFRLKLIEKEVELEAEQEKVK